MAVSVSSYSTNVNPHDCHCERARDRARERESENHRTQQTNNGKVWNVNRRNHTWICAFIQTKTEIHSGELTIACFIYNLELVCTKVLSENLNIENMNN